MDTIGRAALGVAVGVGVATGAHAREQIEPQVWVRSSFTVVDATPAPSGHELVSQLSPATGFLFTTDDIEDLARKASRHVKAMSFLPVDPESDRIVEELFASRRKDEPIRPLTRRV